MLSPRGAVALPTPRIAGWETTFLRRTEEGWRAWAPRARIRRDVLERAAPQPPNLWRILHDRGLLAPVADDPDCAEIASPPVVKDHPPADPRTLLADLPAAEAIVRALHTLTYRIESPQTGAHFGKSELLEGWLHLRRSADNE